jgi:hypothetical protein
MPFPWGRVSGPAGLAPEALQEHECSCRGLAPEALQERECACVLSIPGVSCFFSGDRHRVLVTSLWWEAPPTGASGHLRAGGAGEPGHGPVRGARPRGLDADERGHGLRAVELHP